MHKACSILTISLILLCSCRRADSDNVRDERAAGDYMTEMTSATTFFAQLIDKDALPGLAEMEKFDVDPNQMMDAQGHVIALKYPVSFTVLLTSTNESTKYRYRLTRNVKDAPWQVDEIRKREGTGDWTLVSEKAGPTN